MLYLIIPLAVALILWLGWTLYVLWGIEQPRYSVVTRYDDFEVRRYEPYLSIYTDVEGTYESALSEGFRILAGYIFGGNTSKSSIAMTAPVTEEEREVIAMTAPVTEEVRGSVRRISFVVPRAYTRDTLPVPTDPRVRILEVPAKQVAVLSFTWYPTATRVEAKKKELIELVGAANLSPIGTPLYAGYNDPYSFPLLQRHEVQLELTE